MTACAVDSCNDVPWARGWCGKHYARWKRYGDPTHVPVRKRRELTANDLLARTVVVGECRIWQGCTNDDGYGYVRHQDRNQPAHRVMYELVVGSVPDGLDLDHLCRQPACIAPHHLEPVTRSENLRRAWSVALACQDMGHAIPAGRRLCDACHTANPVGDAACQLAWETA